jgi:hypothetical protein
MSRHKKELARPNSLSDYEQMAEAIRNSKSAVTALTCKQ